MNLDKYGLPVQSDGDAADQLQRVGMIGVGVALGEYLPVVVPCTKALDLMLQPRLGRYSRFVGATIDDVTGDQLIPVMAFWVLTSNILSLLRMKWVLAQNTRKQGELDVRTFPDFILLRALPFILRVHILLYPIVYVADLLLVGAALAFVLQNRGFDDVDDNNLVITLVTCRARMPTVVSLLAARLYRKLRAYSPEYALRRYHRAESGGNPEIGEQWCRLSERYL